MNVVLADHFRDQYSIGLLLNCQLQKVFILNLSAKISRIQPLIPLESVVSGKPLHIKNGINTHRVGIIARAGPENDELSTDLSPNHFINFVTSSLLSFDLQNFDLSEID